jgi:hypothetical protein
VHPGNVSFLSNTAAVCDLVLIFGRARSARRCLGFLKSFEPIPRVGYVVVCIDSAALEVQQEAIGLPVFGIAAAPMRGDANDAERSKLPERG